jgi:hypothetical protein
MLYDISEWGIIMFKKLFIITAFFSLFFVSCVSDDENECDFNNPCADGFNCIDGKCVESIVEESDEDDSDLPVETPDETEDKIVIPDDFEWNDDSEQLCEPLELLFCDPDDIYSVVRCNSMGDDIESVPCGDMTVCENAKCVQQICTPGEPFCKEEDLSKVFKCNEYGSGTTMEVIEDCGQGGYCQLDKCIFYCDIAAQQRSYQGCDYVTANLDTRTNRDDPIFAIVIANTDNEITATIDITVSEDGTSETGLEKCFFCIDDDQSCMSMVSCTDLQVGPEKLGIIQLPHDKMLKETSKSWNSYRIKSSIPITAYQFSPIDNSHKNPFNTGGNSSNCLPFVSCEDNSAAKSYSNDASLLIPVTALSGEYRAVTFESVMGNEGTVFQPDLKPWPSFVTVIGTSAEETEVIFTPSDDIVSGENIPAISAGSDYSFTIKKMEVYHFATDDENRDLTGSWIRCKNKDEKCSPFVVFSGNASAVIPLQRGYADHLEQQMFPVGAWGKEYLLVKAKVRGEEHDYARIVASEDGTNITYLPESPVSFPPFTSANPKTVLDAGEWTEFYFKGTYEIKSDKPVMVVQFLTGADMISEECRSGDTEYHTENCPGDPAMMLIPPTEQFRKDYIFLTPGSYEENFATIVFKDETEVTLNEEQITDSTKIEGSGFSFVVVELGEEFARHTLLCEEPCGLYVYGWEADVSYAYPGGLDFEILSSN